MAFIAWTTPTAAEREALLALLHAWDATVTVADLEHVMINGCFTVPQLRELPQLAALLEAIEAAHAPGEGPAEAQA